MRDDQPQRGGRYGYALAALVLVAPVVWFALSIGLGALLWVLGNMVGHHGGPHWELGDLVGGVGEVFLFPILGPPDPHDVSNVREGSIDVIRASLLCVAWLSALAVFLWIRRTSTRD